MMLLQYKMLEVKLGTNPHQISCTIELELGGLWRERENMDKLTPKQKAKED